MSVPWRRREPSWDYLHGPRENLPANPSRLRAWGARVPVVVAFSAGAAVATFVDVVLALLT